MLHIAEPFAIQDIYVDKVRVQPMKNGLYRFILIRETDEGCEALPYALVVALPNIMENLGETARGIGLRFAGSFQWERPH